VLGQLGAERRLNDAAGELREQPARAGDLLRPHRPRRARRPHNQPSATCKSPAQRNAARCSAVVENHLDPQRSTPTDVWLVELLIVHEADCLKSTGREPLRDHRVDQIATAARRPALAAISGVQLTERASQGPSAARATTPTPVGGQCEFATTLMTVSNYRTRGLI
jgi:hypothetical protein